MKKGPGWNQIDHARATSIRAAVDLHCHILPGIDDGADGLGDAIAMARQAEADGIEAICATPHIRHDHDVRIAELPRRLSDLSAAIETAGCRTKLLPGGEVAVTVLDALDDDELRNLTLGAAGRWILLEPAPGPLDASLDRAVARLCERKLRAVIAHPERHLAPDLIERLRRLVDGGALVQATAAFLLDVETRDGMVALARAGLIHVLGSDSHSSRAGRPVALTGGLEVLRTVEPLASHLEWIARIAPLAIVSGEDLTPPFQIVPAAR
jgi:protein-tyrosine phosphatase